MEPTAKQVMDEVLRAQDLITESRGEALTAIGVREAVKDGLAAALSDPDVWAGALKAMQRHAQAEAGGWVFSGIKALVGRVFILVVVGMGVYAIGGWSALATLLKGHE